MGLRRKGREIVLQTLYSLDFDHDATLDDSVLEKKAYQQILNSILESNTIKADSKICEFSETLLITIISNLITIDDMIKTHLDHWTIDKLAVLDRNLLRLAIAEIIYQKTPPAIAIDEALEIAKKYCCEQTGKLINGVLDHIVKNISTEPSKQ